MFGREKWVKLSSRRNKVFVLAIVFVVSVILSPFLSVQPAYADTAGKIHDINYKHYAATYLRDCLYHLPNETKNTVLQARANDPNRFFASSWKVGIGRYLESTDGVAGCEEGELIKRALLSLGYADNPGKLLTDIGYTVDKTELGCSVQNVACENGKQNRYTRPTGGDQFNTFFATALSPQPQYAQYVAYMSIFNDRCKLIQPPTGNGSAVTYKKVVEGSDGEYKVESTKAEFVIEDKGTINGKKVTFDTGNTQIEHFEYENLNTKCRDLLAIIDTLADSVKDYNNKNKEDPISTAIIPGGDDTDCSANPDSDQCKDKPTCTIEGVGWLICPALTFVAGINDAAYGFLASNFLSVDPDLVKNANDAWSKFRDVANICFVIALLFVVYSQITSIGISNYGIKRMLPRIVVAALLVNMSFIICQLAVDASNILGYGLSHFFVNTIGIGDTPSDSSQFSIGTGLTYTGVTVAAIAGAGVLFLALSVPVLLSAFLAIAMIVLILIARQALIVLLVAIAPLAFVAYLLPNTEEWFKKWRKAFVSLLVLFPLIAVIFGASSLAANILNDVAGKTGNNVLQWAALGAASIPFLAVPKALQKANEGFGDFGAKLSNWADRSRQKVGSNVRDKSMLGAYKKQYDRSKQIKRAQVLGGVYSGNNPLSRLASGGNRLLNKSPLSGKMGDRMAASGAAEALKLRNEDVDNEMLRMQGDWQPHEELDRAEVAYADALRNDDVVKARAAQKILLSKGGAGAARIRSVVQAGDFTGTSAAVRGVKSDLAAAGLKGKDAGLNAWSYDSSERSLASVDNDAKTYTGLTDAELASQTHGSLVRAANSGGLSRTRSSDILDNKDLHGSMTGDTRSVFENVKSGTAVNPADSPDANTAKGQTRRAATRNKPMGS